MIIPDTLKKGDVVALISPSGKVDKDVITLAENFLTEWGLVVKTGTFCSGEYHVFSGRKDERLSDLQAALDDSEVKAIFCSRGGYGSVQYLDKISLKGITSYPKWLIGFSDITVLHSLLNRSGIASLHGPMPVNYYTLLADSNDKSLDYLQHFLFNGTVDYSWKATSNKEAFSVSGDIVGGNMSVLAGIRGSLYEPYYHGKILFLEDLNEYLYHVDRLMHNFKYGGVFNRVNALLIGGFTDLKDSVPPFGQNIEQLFMDVANEVNIPVVFGFNAGHQKPNYALPFGQLVTLDYDKGMCRLKTSDSLLLGI